MHNDQYDLAVIGGGPGGYVAAIRAAQLGLRTLLVERDHLGGICLNWGCIPTKALLRSAEVYQQMLNAEVYGLSAMGPSYDIGKVVQRSRSVAQDLSRGVAHLLKKNKVSVTEGHARLAGPGKLNIEHDGTNQEVHATHIILATGARARHVSPIEPDGKLVWSYKEAMTPDHMPKSLLIVGSGAIGIEFASFYRSFGCEVTVIEMAPRVLPAEDEEIAAFARKAFEKQGIRFHTSASVQALKKQASSVVATVTVGGKQIDLGAERLIAAVGIVGNIEDIGLETTRVEVRHTHIVTDEWCRTAEQNVYAIGDVAGAPWLAHKASHEGVLCVERIAGHKGSHPLVRERIPGCTYSHPQIASVGLTEAVAKERGHELRIGRFPFHGNGKAIALGEPDGLVKTVFDSRTGELLGAHLAGAEVTELVQGFVIGMTLETTEEELMRTIFPHPTLSEMMHEATLSAYGRAVHI